MILRRKRRNPAAPADIVYKQGRDASASISFDWKVIRRADGRWGVWIEIIDLISGKWISRTTANLADFQQAMGAVQRENPLPI